MDKGAHFYRCDFQVHTPRDQNWKGEDAVSDDERMAYARTLVAACRQKGLQAIAVTDHHDLAFVRYVRAAAADETNDAGIPYPPDRRIVVFPGVELTLGVPCQALLLLDQDFPENMFAAVLTALTIAAIPDEQPRNGNVVRLDNIHSFVTLKETLDRHTFLKDHYIVLPNVTGEGEFSLLRAGQMGKYIEMPCVGGFTDGSIANLKSRAKAIIDGVPKEWGNKRIACIQTSDNRHEDHRDLARVPGPLS